MATTIKWIDDNIIETAHRIYKSSTYFTKDNLPAPLVELGPDITEYVDTVGVDGENWYIVSALLNDYEVFSEPFIPGITTAYIHDVFGDGSAVATYQFDGDATDLGGTYNATTETNISYSSGLILNSLTSNGDDTRAIFPISKTSTNPLTMSFWFYAPEYRRSCVISFESRFNFGLWLESDGTMYFSNGSYDSNPMSTIPSSRWVHITIVYAPIENQGLFYLDKTLLNTVTPNTAASTSLYVFGDTSSYPHQSVSSGSMMDQLRIFNRALTQEEVNTLYQEGADFL